MVINATENRALLLLDKLNDKQKTEGLSDYAFTASLGIERSTWTHIRRGRRAIGIKLLRGIINAYPDLIPDIITFLRGDNEHQENSS